MGKKSKKYPAYSSGSVTVNGNTVATTTRDKKNNIVSTSYNMSDTEKKLYDSVQNGLNSSVNNLFNISDAQRKEWNNQMNALKAQGISEINSIYEPMETNLRNDVARRFGNLDNSVFLDNLNTITDKKAKSIADLSNNLLSVQNQLYNQELQNRMNTISLLNNLNTSINNNILSYTGLANTNSTLGNNYNHNAYNSTVSSSGSSFLGSLTGLAGSVASASGYPTLGTGLSSAAKFF